MKLTQNVKAKYSKVNDKILLASATAAAFAASTPTLADLPDAGDLIPDGVEATDPIGMGTQFVLWIIQFLCVAGGAAVTVGGGILIYRSFAKTANDRDEEAWGNFIKTTIAGVFVIALVDALAILGFTYAANFGALGGGGGGGA